MRFTRLLSLIKKSNLNPQICKKGLKAPINYFSGFSSIGTAGVMPSVRALFLSIM